MEVQGSLGSGLGSRVLTISVSPSIAPLVPSRLLAAISSEI